MHYLKMIKMTIEHSKWNEIFFMYINCEYYKGKIFYL